MPEQSIIGLLFDISREIALRPGHKLRQDEVRRNASKAQEEAGFHTTNAIIESMNGGYMRAKQRSDDAWPQLERKRIIGSIVRRFQP